MLVTVCVVRVVKVVVEVAGVSFLAALENVDQHIKVNSTSINYIFSVSHLSGKSDHVQKNLAMGPCRWCRWSR